MLEHSDSYAEYRFEKAVIKIQGADDESPKKAVVVEMERGIQKTLHSGKTCRTCECSVKQNILFY